MNRATEHAFISIAVFHINLDFYFKDERSLFSKEQGYNSCEVPCREAEVTEKL